MDKTLCKNIPINSKKIFGSGGSQTVIVITPNNKVYKYFINFSRKDEDEKFIKKNLKKFRPEIDIHKYLTENIVNKNLSPHIAKLENSLFCNSTPHFLFKKCPTYEKFLLAKKNPKESLSRECIYLMRGHPIKIEKEFLIANIEYCPLTLKDVITGLMRKSDKTLENNLNRIIFQIIYTLAVVQKKYPYFVHHDLFIRNILVTENKAKNKEYIRYYFGKYIFDVPGNGFMCKITDFGETNLNEKNHKTSKLVKSPCEDVFNFIYDIYNGGNLGAESCISIARKRKNKKKEEFLHKYFSNFINTEIIQTIEKNDKKYILNWEWKQFYDPKMIKLLKVKLPSEYLKYFSKIYPTDKEHNIIHTYGK